MSRLGNGKGLATLTECSIEEYGDPKQQANVTIMSEEFVQRNKTAKVFQMEKVNENLEWLEKSLTCISDLPKDVEVLRSMI